MKHTKHAMQRAQQRAIDPLAHRLLDEFGEEIHVGQGCVRQYFSHRSVRNMERALGRRAVALFGRYLNAFRVERLEDGATVTCGWQDRRIRRP